MLRVREMAKHIGISPSGLSMIANDKRGIGWGVANKLSAAGRRRAEWWMRADLPKIIAELEIMWRGYTKRSA
jgi:plasmid maintenance system antidote protein VapI